MPQSTATYIMEDPREAARLERKVDAEVWARGYLKPHIFDGAEVLSVGCGPRRSEEAVMPPSRPLVEVLADHTPEWMAFPGVAGTAESQLADGRPCILVIVVRLTPELRKRIPETVEGWPVRIEETGEIRAMPDSGR